MILCRSFIKPWHRFFEYVTYTEVVVSSAGLAALSAQTYMFCHIAVQGCSSCRNTPHSSHPPHHTYTHTQHTDIGHMHHTLLLTEFHFPSLSHTRRHIFHFCCVMKTRNTERRVSLVCVGSSPLARTLTPTSTGVADLPVDTRPLRRPTDRAGRCCGPAEA